MASLKETATPAIYRPVTARNLEVIS